MAVSTAAIIMRPLSFRVKQWEETQILA